MSNIIDTLEAEQMTREVPEFRPGDTVVVKVKVVEGSRERLQAFEGVCIARPGCRSGTRARRPRRATSCAG